MAFHGCEHARDEAVIQLQVAVEDENPLTGSGSNTRVHSLTETTINRAANHGHALNFGEGGGRNIIRDNNLDISRVNALLSTQSVNNGKNRFRLAVERNNRRNTGSMSHNMSFE